MVYNPDSEYKMVEASDLEEVQTADLDPTDILLVVIDGEIKKVSITALKTLMDGIA